MTAHPLLIRPEQPGDERRTREIQVRAFQRPDTADEPVEAKLLDDLRASSDWIPKLSLVAVLDEDVVGHVVCTRGTLLPDDQALGLGPIGVEPGRQREGVGSALVHAAVATADALDESFIALLGSPLYYKRFGFVRAQSIGIEPPEPAWGEDFQVRTLSSYDPSLKGRFRYASAFDGL